MPLTQNKSLILTSHPEGFPIPGKDLTIQDAPIDLDAPLGADSLLLKTNYISYDPFQRGRMRATKSYVAGYALGEALSNNGISTVVASTADGFQPGDVVVGTTSFAEYAVVSGVGFAKLDNPRALDPKLFLGALGMSGLTAYSSLYEIGRPQKGDTVFVSAASGSVGQMVGQLAKRAGCTVIGSVGSEKKLKFILEECGFDSGFVYKTEHTRDALKRLAGEPGEGQGKSGVDIYYDNVGGETLDVALEYMNDFGRIVCCGSVSQTSLKPEDVYGLKNMGKTVQKRLTLRGFIVWDKDMGPKYTEEHQKKMQEWIQNGDITAKMSVTDGIDNAAEGLVGMLKGENFGKALLRIADL